MRQTEPIQKMVIEKMAERSMADIVEQGRQSYETLDVSKGRDRLRPTSLNQRRIEASNRPTAQVHCAQDVLKARVLGARVDPPGALQLMNAPQTLHPRMIDKRLLGRFFAIPACGEGNVTVQRIADQAFRIEMVLGHVYVSRPPNALLDREDLSAGYQGDSGFG